MPHDHATPIAFEPDQLLPPGFLDRGRTRRGRCEPEPDRHPEIRTRPSRMAETRLGGVLEEVPGFVPARAVTHGYRARPLPADARFGQPLAAPMGFAEPLGFGRAAEACSGRCGWTRIPDTTRAPFRAICHLEITYADGSEALGTGWFAGPDILITSGRTLCTAPPGRPRAKARTIRVVPGRDGRLGPFGETCGVETDLHPRWRDAADPAADIGMIRIADRTLGRSTGWFGAAVFRDRDLEDRPIVQCAGYPGRTRPGGTQWYDACRTVAFDAAFLRGHADAEPGEAGAPVFFTSAEGQRWVVAMHLGPAAGAANLALRVTDDIFDRLVAWTG